MIWAVSLFLEDKTAAVFVHYMECNLSGLQYNKTSPDLHHVHVQRAFQRRHLTQRSCKLNTFSMKILEL